MENKYKITERTPEAMQCAVGTCPAIYEIERKTPQTMECTAVTCPEIYEDSTNGSYLIVGRVENAEEFGLGKKVGKGEVLVSVPKGLIDEMEK